MCFPASCVAAIPSARALYRRWLQGPSCRIVMVDGELRASPGQPLLSHRGWVPAGVLGAGDYLVAASGVQQWPLEAHWSVWQEKAWTVDVSCPVGGLWGDGDPSFNTSVCGDVHAAGPMARSAGEMPDADPWRLLAALTSAGAFGATTWERACAQVPQLASVWPHGEPSARGRGLPAGARSRLGGAALAALPEPQVDTATVAARFLGVEASLGLARVVGVETTQASGWFCNAACSTSTMIVSGVVAGSAA